LEAYASGGGGPLDAFAMECWLEAPPISREEIQIVRVTMLEIVAG
jgi:hypothetical protein